ncbi:MAG: exonuclease SbcCD subunit D C-terminal domain-containing protein [Lentisphaerales bacterium]|nr:exonuclease SbcCD subunit D C-terminal domain-containing protein [Lentisphaerales bacterium]
MFRFIHTSDWHLGQSFMNQSREAEHRIFLNWLIEQIKQHEVDALIVAGDIFDTGTPPSYARKLYYDFLKDLNRTCGIPLVIIGGNHDSISTLNESGTLLKLLNIHVIGGKTSAEEETFVLSNRNGEDSAIICAVPFLRDRDVRLSVEGETFKDKKDSLRLGIKRHYQETLSVANKLNGNRKLPIIATGHLTTSGGELTDGVRDIYIGSLESYDSNDFPDEFDYIALGHLHTKQVFGKRQHIRYCGSPIPISFGEAKQQKIVKLVEVKQGKDPVVQELNIPVSRILKSISGSLEEIQQEIASLETDLELPTWIEVVLHENTEISSAQTLLKEATKELTVDILRFRRNRAKKNRSIISKEKELSLKEISVEDVFEQRLSTVELESKIQTELKGAFKEIYHEALKRKDS